MRPEVAGQGLIWPPYCTLSLTADPKRRLGEISTMGTL